MTKLREGALFTTGRANNARRAVRRAGSDPARPPYSTRITFVALPPPSTVTGTLSVVTPFPATSTR